MAHPVMKGYKMQPTYLLVVFAIVVQHTLARDFPKFIQKCKVSDPKFDECVLSSANNFVSSIYKGDDKFGIPPLILSNETISYNVTENFNFKFTNMSTNLYKNYIIPSIHFDFEKKLLVYEAKSAQVHCASNYDAGAEILGKPAHETGKVNMTFDHIELNAIVTLDFKMKNDKKYIEAVSCILVVNIRNFQFKPYDQVTVGEPMTAEQKKVYQSYIDKLPEVMKRDNEKHDKFIVNLLNTVFETLPFEDIFIP